MVADVCGDALGHCSNRTYIGAALNHLVPSAGLPTVLA